MKNPSLKVRELLTPLGILPTRAGNTVSWSNGSLTVKPSLEGSACDSVALMVLAPMTPDGVRAAVFPGVVFWEIFGLQFDFTALAERAERTIASGGQYRETIGGVLVSIERGRDQWRFHFQEVPE